ncbi:MAG: peptidoglycan glycosyltransferase [Sphingomonadales bacterium RIFCSPHIGHO2_01_FULL_65_20]|jgi:cell division protein FtsI (penicillin-binding protein 3)|uniref:Penicillin-binding protein 2 n=1 Tax=Sphingomonas ursincola TaxID=56361 RepID=A0A7V8U7N5_9SPHN|nr:penicillin-binding protein 2 [Sphingomonas ursincola]MBA4778239.1 penicillin-binding protein 2 [Blastomonas sp.]OHC97872.1 MAG: peptidoglycan glycosyltransferase [Sphingomonadales bacterium RIFCSPHIGHO2_01_FULL_65_20]MBA1373612.1 penicillin-binding protein 2 [Sphingomonas ursincola]MBY0619948.1 penicillin-binding protein 2 [Sphingomonas ursincola]MCH2239639.1 penicillin-binding protein 2 [Blastomonas sp.]
MTALASGSHRVRLASKRQHLTLTAQVRLVAVLALFGLGVGAILLRLTFIGVFGEQAQAATRGALVDPGRGDIVDRNGVPLARTIDGYAIRVVPSKLIGDRKVLAAKLAEIFPDTSEQRFLKLLSRTKPTYLRHRAIPEEVNRVHALGEVGIEFPREKERFYPQLQLAAHVLGYVHPDGHGVSGMERAMDEELLDPRKRLTPSALSIDIRVQAALEDELGKGMKAYDAKAAAGIVLDVETGEVMAMTSLPSFNPNQFNANSVAFEANQVTYRFFELGSTFKPLTVAAAIDAGTVTSMARRYDASRPLRVAGFQIRDSHSSGRWLNVPETLVHSSNIVTAQIADELGPERLQAVMRKLHFDRQADINLRERAKPLWPSQWGRLTNMTVSYGHGIAVTPLHLASAYAAMVNGGLYRPATLLKLNPADVPRGERVFKASTSARMNQLLRMIVRDGTGRKAEAPGFRVGGKTGSAEKPGAGGYKRSSVVATFAAAFPMDKPRYVVIVMIDEPSGNSASSFQRTAGWTAAPVVAKLVPRIGPMLGVIPDDRRDVDVSELMPLLWKAPGKKSDDPV